MRVLRMRNGDEAEVFDGEGRTARGRTEFSSEGTVLIAESYPEHGRESPLFITLAQAFVSPDKMEWITEKAVEAGASRIVFFPAARSVTKLSGDKLTKRLAFRTERGCPRDSRSVERPGARARRRAVCRLRGRS